MVSVHLGVDDHWPTVRRVVPNRVHGPTPADWDPVSSRNDVFPGWSTERDGLNLDDPWQFTNFLTR
jgi:homospermidine synthase